MQCPLCKNWTLEKEIEEFLRLHNLTFYHDRETNGHLKWLKKQRLDFYLPQYKVAIECQGIQHFKPFSFAKNSIKEDKKINLKKQQLRDERKRKLCEENGIKLLYYSNLGIDYPYKVYEDKEELLKEILKENE